jgi:uncharacterized protein (DUF1330 family)
MAPHKPSYGQVDREYGKRMFMTPPEDDGPVWMVNFMKYREEATYADGTKGVSGKEADDRYAPTKILHEIGASVPFFGDVVLQLAGKDVNWDRIGVVKYPTRHSFLNMQNREDFQKKHEHKDAGMEFTFVIGCQPMDINSAFRPPVDTWADLEVGPTDDDGPIMVIHLLKFVEGGLTGSMNTYETEAFKFAQKVGAGPAAFFNVEGTIMGDGRQWDQVRFVAYPSMRAFMQVVNDPDRVVVQESHRQPAIADTYTVVVRPSIDTFTTQGPV